MYVRRLPLEGIWTVYAACTDRRDCELLEFLEGLDANLQASVDGFWALMDHVAQRGPHLNHDLSHQLRGDIYEFVKGRIRILYFCDRGRVIVCTHGLIKKKMKIGNAEIAKAEGLMTEYRSAVQSNELVILEVPKAEGESHE